MKMSKRQIEILKGFGEDDESIEQVERAATVTIYKYKGRRISRKKAIELLGEEEFLSGLDRSAFHWTCIRWVDNEKADKSINSFMHEYVYFDSRRFFEDW